MAGRIGRKVALTWAGTALNGVREKSAAYGGTPIDVTDGASDGWRELLDEDGERTVDISVSGVVKDAVLKSAFFATDRVQAMTITYPDGGILSGDFFLVSYSESEPYKDASTFEASFQSTGTVTYIAA